MFLLTDGEVDNTDAVVALCARQHGAAGTRVFTFGIGAEVSHALVRGAATAGGGHACGDNSSTACTNNLGVHAEELGSRV